MAGYALDDALDLDFGVALRMISMVQSGLHSENYSAISILGEIYYGLLYLDWLFPESSY